MKRSENGISSRYPRDTKEAGEKCLAELKAGPGAAAEP